MQTLELHPLCTIFPRLSDLDLDCLRLDIKEHGLREPIVLFDGMILDGGNRYKACLAAGVEPIFKQYEGDDIAAYVLSANFHRRHLPLNLHALIVASVQDWTKAYKLGDNQRVVPWNHPQKLVDNQRVVPWNHPQDSTASRAKQSGASLSTQKRADAVVKADPELAKKVVNGEVKFQDAVKQVAPQFASKSSKCSMEPIALEDAYDPKEHELEEAHQAIVDLAEENQKLKDAIAVGHLPPAEQSASEIIADLRNQIKTLQEINKTLTESRNILQNENAAMNKQILMQRREIDGLKKKAAVHA